MAGKRNDSDNNKQTNNDRMTIFVRSTAKMTRLRHANML